MNPIANVSGTADTTYSANEVTLLNDTVTAVYALLAQLRDKGYLRTS